MTKKHIIPTGLLAALACFTMFAEYWGMDFDSGNEEEVKKFDELVFGHAPWSLPLQAGICDIIGVGRVTNAVADASSDFWEGSVDLVVDNFWRGNPGTNTFTIQMGRVWHPPVTNTPLVFYLISYNSFRMKNDEYYRYRHVFSMDEYRKNHKPEVPIFYAGDKSWFHITDDNADLVAFASNLVVAVDSQNTNEFYKIIIEGMNDYKFGSRIHDDSFRALKHCVAYFDTNFIHKIWKDPMLKDISKHFILHKYHNKYDVWLPIEPETIIVIR